VSTTRHKWTVLVIAVCLAAALAVSAGCGSSDTTTTAEPGTTGTTSSDATATTEPAGPVKVVVAQGVDPTTMDPHQQRETSTVNVLLHIYDPLLERDAQDPTKFNGILATSWTQVDPTTVEFKLQAGVTFSGGEPFDAECVKYNVDRLLGFLPGTEPALLAYQFGTIESTEVVDAETVRIKTKVPDPLILSRMALLYMIPTGSVDADPEALMSEPNGTGPYNLVEWDRNNQVVLQAKEDYFRGAPTVDELVFRTIPEASTRLAEIQVGNVDIITNVPPENAAEVGSQGQADVKEVPSSRIAAVWLDTLENPTLAKKEVRQALNYAVDVEAITQDVMSGYGMPVATIVPSYWVAYNPDLKPYPFDQAKARELLAAAGVPDGFEVEMLLPRGRYLMAEEVAQAVVADLAGVGVNVKLNAVEFGVFAEATQARQIPGMFYAAWGEPFFDPGGMLEVTVRSGTDGFSWFNNPEIDALIDEAQSTVGDEHVNNLQEVEKAIYEDPPFIFLFAQKDLYGVSNRLDWSPRSDEWIILYGASVK